MARHLTELRDTRESASREVGLTALQLWQAVSEKAGRGHGHEGAAILFTDLVDFSSWVLDVGDEAALDLLRAVSGVVEPAIKDHDGRLVKRLGDGHMAVFGGGGGRGRAPRWRCTRASPTSRSAATARSCARASTWATRAASAATTSARDVNIAARIMDAAKGGELLVSEAVDRATDCSGVRGQEAPLVPRQGRAARAAGLLARPRALTLLVASSTRHRREHAVEERRHRRASPPRAPRRGSRRRAWPARRAP